MTYSGESSSLNQLVQERTRPPIPVDNLCQTCHINPQKYFKKQQYMCLYCWERDEYPKFSVLSDTELDTLRQSGLKKLTEEPQKVSIVNAGNLMGFKTQ